MPKKSKQNCQIAFAFDETDDWASLTIVSMADAMDRAETARQLDINGWTEIKSNPLSKVGIFPYRGSQIPGAPDPDAIYMVYRPEEELADPECIESFKLIPWIDNHVMLGNEDEGLTPPERKGIQGVVGEDVNYSDGVLKANIKVFSGAMKRLIDSGKRELSCGYRCIYDWTGGVFQGKRYDAIQRKIRGNHLALVQSGRMGPDVAVLDSLDHFVFALDMKDAAMPDEKKDEDKKDDESASSETKKPSAEAMKEPELSHSEFAAALKKFMPIMEKFVGMARGSEESKAAAGGATEVRDTEEDKPGGKSQTPGKDPDETKKESEAMDASVRFKQMAAQFAARDDLARKLSVHVGTFDHSLMTVDDVAKYGVEKLGITAPAGTETAALQGYLHAMGAKPATQVAATAQDAGHENFVTKFLAA